jgi:hypothetical protein
MSTRAAAKRAARDGRARGDAPATSNAPIPASASDTNLAASVAALTVTAADGGRGAAIAPLAGVASSTTVSRVSASASGKVSTDAQPPEPVSAPLFDAPVVLPPVASSPRTASPGSRGVDEVETLQRKLAEFEAKLAAKDEEHQEALAAKDEALAAKDEALAAKDEELQEALAAKDRLHRLEVFLLSLMNTTKSASAGKSAESDRKFAKFFAGSSMVLGLHGGLDEGLQHLDALVRNLRRASSIRDDVSSTSVRIDADAARAAVDKFLASACRKIASTYADIHSATTLGASSAAAAQQTVSDHETSYTKVLNVDFADLARVAQLSVRDFSVSSGSLRPDWIVCSPGTNAEEAKVEDADVLVVEVKLVRSGFTPIRPVRQLAYCTFFAIVARHDDNVKAWMQMWQDRFLPRCGALFLIGDRAGLEKLFSPSAKQHRSVERASASAVSITSTQRPKGTFTDFVVVFFVFSFRRRGSDVGATTESAWTRPLDFKSYAVKSWELASHDGAGNFLRLLSLAQEVNALSEARCKDDLVSLKKISSQKPPRGGGGGGSSGGGGGGNAGDEDEGTDRGGDGPERDGRSGGHGGVSGSSSSTSHSGAPAGGSSITSRPDFVCASTGDGAIRVSGARFFASHLCGDILAVCTHPLPDQLVADKLMGLAEDGRSASSTSPVTSHGDTSPLGSSPDGDGGGGDLASVAPAVATEAGASPAGEYVSPPFGVPLGGAVAVSGVSAASSSNRSWQVDALASPPSTPIRKRTRGRTAQESELVRVCGAHLTWCVATAKVYYGASRDVSAWFHAEVSCLRAVRDVQLEEDDWHHVPVFLGSGDIEWSAGADGSGSWESAWRAEQPAQAVLTSGPAFAPYVRRLSTASLADGDPEERRRIRAHALDAVSCVHRARWAHNDLAPDNFIMHTATYEGGDAHLVLIDYGMAAPLGTDARVTARVAYRSVAADDAVRDDEAFVAARAHDMESLAYALAGLVGCLPWADSAGGEDSNEERVRDVAVAQRKGTCGRRVVAEWDLADECERARVADLRDRDECDRGRRDADIAGRTDAVAVEPVAGVSAASAVPQNLPAATGAHGAQPAVVAEPRTPSPSPRPARAQPRRHRRRGARHKWRRTGADTAAESSAVTHAPSPDP